MDNELITRGERAEFTTELIKQRGFVRAKYWSWESPRNGLITYACKDFLRVLFQTGINAATSYFPIKINEVTAGLWDVTYSPDLEHLYHIDGGEPEEDIDLPTEVRKLFEE